jgi:hypothetical protein
VYLVALFAHLMFSFSLIYVSVLLICLVLCVSFVTFCCFYVIVMIFIESASIMTYILGTFVMQSSAIILL